MPPSRRQLNLSQDVESVDQACLALSAVDLAIVVTVQSQTTIRNERSRLRPRAKSSRMSGEVMPLRDLM